jgi:hypothetical protein
LKIVDGASITISLASLLLDGADLHSIHMEEIVKRLFLWKIWQINTKLLGINARQKVCRD